MKTLYLVRHAKSSWKYDGLQDMDRPLKGRGVRDAYSTSEWLAEQGCEPDHLVSSPATRALHTAMIFSKNLEFAINEIRIDDNIYHAGSKDLMHILRRLDDKYESVMVFGHNPTITDFVNKCIDHRIDNIPTTGVACLRFDADRWQDLDKKADLVFFDYPKRRSKN